MMKPIERSIDSLYRHQTYICFYQISPMWHKIIVVLHIPALLHPHEVFHRIEILSGARARQELLYGHSVTEEH